MRRLKLLALLVFRHIGIFHLASWLTRRRLKILCYHGFALHDEASFRGQLFITPATFKARLAVLRRLGMVVLPLDEAVDRLRRGDLPNRSVVITIDDGFHSVHKAAAPLLSQHGMPATVYVTTYYVEHGNPVFRLAIQYMFWKAGKRRLPVAGVAWASDGEIDLTDPAARDAVAWQIIRHGETRCTEPERVGLTREVGEWLGVSYDEICRKRLLHLMTPEELRGLAAMGVDIQLHTHRHRFPDDDVAVAEREILENRAALTRIVGPGNYQHFCYPSGEWRANQWAWLDRLGVKSSTTCAGGLNTHSTPHQALRRFLDGEKVHALEFEAVVSGLLR